jgi:hypothetical protein
LCGYPTYNISEEYVNQISNDSETEAEFDSSDSRSSHVHDTALREVKGKMKVMRIFYGKIWAIMLDKEKLFETLCTIKECKGL